MSFSRIIQNLQRAPSFMKFIGFGSLILAISTVLPWYADLDAYNVGDLFLGVTGPASLVGIIILLISLASFSLFLLHLIERSKPKLPVKEPVFHLFVGIASLFLLLIVNSIYFHPKFGVNITLKDSKFGMLLAILGAIFMIAGGYLQYKKEIKTEDLIGKLEPLVKAPELYERRHASMPTKKGMIEKAQEQLLKEELTEGENKPQPRGGEGKGSGGGSYMIRTDL